MTKNQVLSSLQFPGGLAANAFRNNDRRPGFVLVGHRGAMALAAENSAASFRLAEDAGVDEIELDIRATADGVPVVVHDPTLERLAAGEPGATIPVSRLTLARLLEIPLASGQPILTFADALELTSARLQVEIKDPAVVPALSALLAQEPAHARRIRFSSFLPEALFLLALHLPEVPRGLIVPSYPATPRRQEELGDVLVTTGAGTLYSGFGNLSPAHVETLQEAGREVHVWPLGCARDVDRALELKADGGTADNPFLARQWLEAAKLPVAAV